MLGVDNTSGIGNVAAMKAAGYGAIFRYLSNSPAKNLIMSAAPYDTELRRYFDGGVAVVLNWESSGHIGDSLTNHPGNPHAQGVEDASRGHAQAALMGHPEAPIYFSIDFDCTDWAGLTAYFSGVASIIGLPRVGVYGGYWVVDHLISNRLVTYVWQTLAWSTVNGARYTRHPRANVIQRIGEVTVAGAACDVNEILTPGDFGQLPRPVSPASTSAPEDAMQLPPIPLPPSTDPATPWVSRRFFCDTVGPPGQVIGRAWLILEIDGPDGATATLNVFPQHAGGGTGPEVTLHASIPTDGTHTSAGQGLQLPTGTNQAQLQWTVSAGATGWLVPAYTPAGQ
jgi:hypothetical protein